MEETMRLKELIFALETHQIDTETGHQIIGDRPELPNLPETTVNGIVFVVNREVTDHKLLKEAKIAHAKHGNLEVIEAKVVEVEKIVEKEVIKEVIKEVPAKPKTTKKTTKK
jgi:hypothetical protein